MLKAYYKFIVLPDEVRSLNKIKSESRLDCISFTDKVTGNYKGLTFFVNSKGQFFLYKASPDSFIESDKKRIAEWSLTSKSINLSSIYIEDIERSEIGYGYPNPHKYIGKMKQPNPLFDFRNDGYLFMMNKDLSELELFIVQDGRNLIRSYYQKLKDGGFDTEIRELRNQAKLFFTYDGLVL
jgi:hypothetical protein